MRSRNDNSALKANFELHILLREMLACRLQGPFLQCTTKPHHEIKQTLSTLNFTFSRKSVVMTNKHFVNFHSFELDLHCILCMPFGFPNLIIPNLLHVFCSAVNRNRFSSDFSILVAEWEQIPATTFNETRGMEGVSSRLMSMCLL